MSLRSWKKLSQKIVFKNDHWSYYLDDFEIEGGLKGQYHYLHTLGSSMVIPATDRNTFLLVNQFRYLNQKEGLEFPCGSIEPELTATENALKELREETGYSAKEIYKAGEFAPFTGASDEICTVFVARDLFQNPLQRDLTEEFELYEKTFEEIEELIQKNIIWDGLTISAWTLAQKHLKK